MDQEDHAAQSRSFESLPWDRLLEHALHRIRMLFPRLSDADRDDLVQDIMLALVRAARRATVVRHEFGLLAAVLQRKVKETLRQQRRRRVVPMSGDVDSLLAPACGPIDEASIEALQAELPERIRPWLREFTKHGDLASIAARHEVSMATVYWWAWELARLIHAHLGGDAGEKDHATGAKKPPPAVT